MANRAALFFAGLAAALTLIGAATAAADAKQSDATLHIGATVINSCSIASDAQFAVACERAQPASIETAPARQLSASDARRFAVTTVQF